LSVFSVALSVVVCTCHGSIATSPIGADNIFPFTSVYKIFSTEVVLLSSLVLGYSAKMISPSPVIRILSSANAPLPVLVLNRIGAEASVVCVDNNNSVELPVADIEEVLAFHCCIHKLELPL